MNPPGRNCPGGNIDIFCPICIEAGRDISDSPKEVILKADEQGYRMISMSAK